MTVNLDLFGPPDRSITLAELRCKLEQMSAATLQMVAKKSGLRLIKNQPVDYLIDRLLSARAAVDALRHYNTFDAAVEAVRAGQLNKDDVHRWYNAVRKGSAACNNAINVELNLLGLRSWGLDTGTFCLALFDARSVCDVCD